MLEGLALLAWDHAPTTSPELTGFHHINSYP